jgi:predicted DNA-binding transcriptional regulator AlpA
LSGKKYITQKQLKARYGDVSDMTIWRWEHDRELGFPKSININRRKYYDLAELEAWERKRAASASGKAACGGGAP